MEIYLVGGAIRDKLLGLPVREKDWVVVGATVEEMLANGYRQVGKDFPVFLHPKTNEEYALARTERKTKPGYKGFTVHASPETTLAEDLKRRDLTINAMAEDEKGKIIDPYNGQKDLQNKIFRHVSDAFVEDPVRILRIARFSAQYHALGFKIADETLDLMKTMVRQGEVEALVPERIWNEFHKALQQIEPQQFFQTLSDCHALEVIIPEEKNVELGMTALSMATKISQQTIVRFTAWCTHMGIDNIKQICVKLKPPGDYQELAELAGKYHSNFENVIALPPPKVLELLKALDGFRREERFENFLLAAESVSKSMPGREGWPHPQREYLHTALNAAKKITAKDLTKTRLEGIELAQELDIHRRAAISKVKRTYRWAKFN